MKKINFQDLIIFENENYIGINKPPFFSTLEDRNAFGKYNVIDLARSYVKTAQVCHRLDKETSGVLVIAKNPDAYRHLSIQFEKRKVKKLYHALVEGVQEFDKVKVDLPILPLRTAVVKIDKVAGKPAQTLFDTLKVYKEHTLVACQPITGRMHQIRIHLAVLKAPIAGDEQYGGKKIFLSQLKKNFNLKKNTEEQALMPRVALHAHRITFLLTNGEEVSIEAGYPKDFAALIRQMDKHAS